MPFQIDSSNPTLNLTVIPDLLNNGTLALQLHKLDTGSGVDGVDIYQLTGEQMYSLQISLSLYCCTSCFIPISLGHSDVKSRFYTLLLLGANNSAMPDVKPLILGTKDDIAVLALSPGSQYQIFASAVDNVGNRRSLEEDMQNFVTIDFPGVVCLNNCSERGVCTEFSTCRCDPGYYGSDCSEGKDESYDSNSVEENYKS